MSDDASRLNELEQRQNRLERVIQQTNGVTIRSKLAVVLDQLRQLAAAVRIDQNNLQQPMVWCDLYDAIEQLRPERDHLPEGFVTRTAASVDELRQRLMRNGRDRYAIRQLHYLEKAVDRAIQKAQHL